MSIFDPDLYGRTKHALAIARIRNFCRAKSWREFGYKQDRTAYVCPIIDWTTDDVWEYLTNKGVPHCSLYDEGYKRIGCVCCPLAPKLSQREAARWPKTAAMLKYGASLFVARMREKGWMTERGNLCADWRLAQDPVEELFHRWIVTGQTTMSVECFQERERERKRAGRPEDAPCLFAGTGFSESDAADAVPTTKWTT